MKKHNLSYDPLDVMFYDVLDNDTNEVLSKGITMENVVRLHGDIIEHLSLKRVAEPCY